MISRLIARWFRHPASSDKSPLLRAALGEKVTRSRIARGASVRRVSPSIPPRSTPTVQKPAPAIVHHRSPVMPNQLQLPEAMPDDDWDDFIEGPNLDLEWTFNPANGLPMLPDSMVDIMGNLVGTDSRAI